GCPRFQGDNFSKNLDLVRHVEQLASEKGITPSQLALAWVLAQGDDIVPIPGTKRRSYLEEDLAAAECTVTEDELRQLDEVFPYEATAGERYADMSMVNL
ncbi:MAG TPA: aldo/keto reductase, partial [Acidobacteriota bacterium]|nr:aldo/keto reductase [Acidobacteriota bacterium]